ncbi:MAG: hypothetical protein QOK07_3386 [Gemmatimonadaceae bacterium]|nr:hypothetical protein [Gemmatimonadaceae bacterium]
MQQPFDKPSNGLLRLERVNPLEVWRLEESQFTPWLLANGDVLGDALGIDLELTEREHRVGPFELDLLGRDLTHDAPLIVENQLTPTDHGHLGQLLTYAGGTDAATIVWISPEFREPHRQALDWLNEHTDEQTHFFGVQLGVVRIGDSAPAPNLNVVSAANDWQKWARRATGGGSGTSESTPRQALYAKFWAALIERVAAERPGWTHRRQLEANRQNWVDFPSRFRPAYYAMSFARGGRLRHELYIALNTADASRELFERLLADREAIERRYGRALTWEPLPGKIACRIADYTDGDVTSTDEHPAYIDWFIDTSPPSATL